jgi:hypothetical protein
LAALPIARSILAVSGFLDEAQAKDFEEAISSELREQRRIVHRTTGASNPRRRT